VGIEFDDYARLILGGADGITAIVAPALIKPAIPMQFDISTHIPSKRRGLVARI